MKDQYFGDFGDYQKISLLKELKKKGLNITTYWMKTSDDNSNDGKHIVYLTKPDEWRSYETEIFDFIYKKIKSGRRSLKHIENSEHCNGINFINQNIETAIVRDEILNDICSSKNIDVVFFDPDNGIEVTSTNKKNLHKYVTWDEIVKTFNSGKSVLIYQHFSRSNREVLIKQKTTEIKKRIDASVISIQVKHSVYFFAYQTKHSKKILQSIKEFSSIWKHLATIR